MSTLIKNYFWLFATIIALSACNSEDLVKKNEQSDKDSKNNPNTPTTLFTSIGNEAPEPSTRTWLKHTMGKKGMFGWTTGDKIWVNNILSNTAELLDDSTRANFQVPGTLTNETYEVIYTGWLEYTSGIVLIRNEHTQTKPNNTEHFRAAGDCAAGIAKKRGGGYTFKLKHKPAYLCFLPRCKNTALGANIYLTKIAATTSAPYTDLNGSYFVFPNSPLALYSGGGSKTTTLNTKGTDAYANGFPLTNTKSNIETNGAFMLIVPGQHPLTIEYHVYDPFTTKEGVITKTVSANFKENTIYDIKADLVPKDYTQQRYWEWNANKHYWEGYESSQPLVNGGISNDYPKSNSTPLDERSYTIWNPFSPPALNVHAKDLPNINEVAWYIKKGDPHWDDKTAWSFGGHLYTGGVWFKKKDLIPGFSNTTTPDGITISNNNDVKAVPTLGKPDNAERDYFFLPALGQYGTPGNNSGTISVGNGSGNHPRYDVKGNLVDLGIVGHYWTGTAGKPNALYSNDAWYLRLSKEKISLTGYMEFSQGNPALGKNYWKAE